MARPRKTETEKTVDPDNFTKGAYTVSKPSDKYVVRVGGSVIYASVSLDDIKKYLDLCGAK